MKPRPGWAGLPRRVRIGWRRFLLCALRRKQRKLYCGRIRMDRGHIQVNPDLSREVLVETVMHEVVHGIHSVWVGETEDMERHVEQEAAGMVALMQDNPGLIRWALATLEER